MIDPAIHNRLRERFNPEGSELRALQTRMLEMLDFIDRVCADNHIDWWLSSGTCLGAMRHGGFIPWDDDVDIEMLEPDYRRLLKIMGTEPHGDYVLQTRANEPGYRMRFAKLRDLRSELHETNSADKDFRYKGAYIDIFYLRPSSSRTLHDKAIFLEKLNYGSDLRHTPAWMLVEAAKSVLFPVFTLIDSIGAHSRLRHPIGSFFTAPRMRGELTPTVRVPFEGRMFPVPADADAYLSRMFGDWRRLPDINSVPTHFNTITILPND